MLLFTGLWRFIPPEILRYVEYLPIQQLKRFKHFLIVSRNTAKVLLDAMSCNVGEEGRDILSILGTLF